MMTRVCSCCGQPFEAPNEDPSKRTAARHCFACRMGCRYANGICRQPKGVPDAR